VVGHSTGDEDDREEQQEADGGRYPGRRGSEQARVEQSPVDEAAVGTTRTAAVTTPGT
jgi:hypothetical protein